MRDPNEWRKKTFFSFSRGLRIAWFTCIAFLGGALATGWASAGSGTESPYWFVGQLARVLVLVENEYVEPLAQERLLEGAVKGLVAELDPHSSYLPKEAFDTFRGDTEGQFGGIGVEVDFRGDAVTVIAAIEGSPAARSGVRPGDEIVAIDHKPVRGRSSEELVNRMRGLAGTNVQISVRRDGHAEALQFVITRQVIEVSSILGKALVDEVAYLRIKQFQAGTHDELLSAVRTIRQRTGGSISGVILDLRNNPGGLVREAIAVADEFLAEGTIFSTRHRGETVETVSASTGGALSREPVVVLINEYTASASELVAGALKDNRRASLIGTRSFGKGSVQSIFPLPGGAGLRLTTMRYYTPSGQAIQALGVQPDIVVEAAYVEDKSFGTVREADLEGHLEAEGTATPKSAEVHRPGIPPAEERPGISPTHLGVAREIPDDPTNGPDFALSIGYQIVRSVLTRSQP
jgi:carboxyl-terminal processing protease